MPKHTQTNFLDVLFTLETRTVEIKRRVIGEKNAKRYGLSHIQPDEWDSFFPKTSDPWDEEDIAYLVEWWEKDDTVSLAYALERPPWTLQNQIRNLRAQGREIPYKKKKGAKVKN